MTESPSTQLARLLLQRIAETLREAGGTLRDRAAVERVVTAVLEDARLAPRERSTLQESDLAASDPVGAALGARIERALAEGLGAAREGQTLSEEPEVPRVVVLREGQAQASSLPEATLREGDEAAGVGPLGTLMEESPAAGTSPRALWVIAQGQAFDAARREANTLAETGGRTIAIEPEGAAGSLAPGADLHLSAWKGGFGAAEEVARRTAGELPRRIPTPARTGATRWNPQAMVGELLHGRYRLERLIGEGGFGAVYEASDERIPIDTTYAIKILQPRALQSKGDVEAFQKEFERVQKCLHPNIVAVHNVDYTDEGLNYIVMERLVGEELDKWIDRKGRMDPDRVGRILLQILAALRKAHTGAGERSILHLDLKPGNVFVTRANEERPDEGIKVLDFGIGQYVGGEDERSDDSPVRAEDEAPSAHQGTLRSAAADDDTSKGRPSDSRTWRSRACTPEYAAPEHCAHCDPSTPDEEILRLDGRADLYSLGVIGFQLLTGQLPHDQPKNRRDLLRTKRMMPPRNVRNMGVAVPKSLARFIERCLQTDREKRWRDAGEAYEALNRVVYPVLTWRKAAMVGVLPLLLLAGGWYLAKGGRPVPLHILDDSVTQKTENPLDTRTLATNEPLYLGPKHTNVSLARDVDRAVLERMGGSDALRLIDETGEVPSWVRSTAVDGGRLSLTLDAANLSSGAAISGTYRVRGYLPGPVFGFPRDNVESDLFRVEYLGEGWTVDGPFHESSRTGLTLVEGRVLDPEGLRLVFTSKGRTEPQIRNGELRLRVDGKDVTSLTLKSTDIGQQRGQQGQTADILRAELDLPRILRHVEGTGPADTKRLEVQLALSDRAGDEVGSSWARLTLKRTPLRDEEPSIDVAPRRMDQDVPGRYEFHKSDFVGGVHVQVSFGRPLGRFGWELLSEGGDRLAGESSVAMGEGHSYAFTLEQDQVDALVASTAGAEKRAVIGHIELMAVEAPEVVQESESRGTWDKTLFFKYVLQDMDFEVVLDDELAIVVGGSEYFLTGSLEGELRVTPNSDSNTRIDVRALTPGVSFESGEARDDKTARRLLPAHFRFHAPAGVVRIGVRASLPRLGSEAESPDEPGATDDPGGESPLLSGERVFTIHVDQTKPTLSAWPPTDPLFGDHDRVEEKTERAVFTVTIDDEHGGTLSWRMEKLTWSSGTDWVWQEVVEPQKTDWVPGTPTKVEFHTPWWMDGIEPGDVRWGRRVAETDGDYRLFLTVTDGAGNSIEAEPFPFEVAVHGPAIDVLQPTPGGQWLSEESKEEAYSMPRFIATAVVFDPNGLPCEPGHSEIACGFECEFDGRRDGRTVSKAKESFKVDTTTEGPERNLKLEHAFLYEWSEATVTLVVRGEDLYENGSFTTVDCFLPHIEQIKPAHIDAIPAAGRDMDVTGLCRVLRSKGNYTFGGREQADEILPLQQWGLSPYTWPRRFFPSRSRDTKGYEPWKVSLSDESFETLANTLKGRSEGLTDAKETDIDALAGHYYLDEHEVTRGQFSQFVEATDGYANERNWPCSSTPSTDDLSTWKGKLSDETDADLPITGVTWAEASAYAAWVGKRLPTAFEWEYAVRGGVQYRPFSTFVPPEGNAEEEMERMHALICLDRSGPWTARESTDRTPETGILDLSGNVQEWTSTALPPAKEHRILATYFSETPTRAITPVDPAAPEPPPRLVVVGSSYSDRNGAFTPVAPRTPEQRREDVGFRCAMSVKEVLDRLGKTVVSEGAHERVLLRPRSK